nr:dephospho-CoA kinase [Allomuricauda sp.]
MKVVGLTGGIGSGKSTVAKMFRALGVPVYDSDYEAKRLMVDSQKIRERVIDLIGPESYLEGRLNRPFIAKIVFADPDMLRRLNEIVHPVVREDFQHWLTQQNTPYAIQETALIFENGAEENYDAVILVTAPLDFRLERVMARDQVGVDEVLRRVKNQMKDDQKKEKAHFVIENLDLITTEKQVVEIHEKLANQDD